MLLLSHRFNAPSGSGRSRSVVIGRDCNRNNSSPLIAHSISCGRPKTCAACRASLATATACWSVSEGFLPSASLKVTAETPSSVAESKTCEIFFRMISRSTIFPARSTLNTSAAASPPTSAVPSPGTADTTANDRRPLTGSALNATPDTSASTIFCTSTAGADSGELASPRCPRYSKMRSLNPESHTAATFPHTSCAATKRNVSNCPANECCDPSSSTADDRTAKRPPSANNSRSASSISRSISSAGLNVNRFEFGQRSCPDASASSCSVGRLAVNADGEIANQAGTGKLASPMRSSASALPPSSCTPPSRLTKRLIQYSIDAKSSERNPGQDTLIGSTRPRSSQSTCRASAPLPAENKIQLLPPHKTKSAATQK